MEDSNKIHSRWCIVAGPRTGSTYFEDMVYRQLRDSYPEFNTLTLNEWLDWWWYQEITSDGNVLPAKYLPYDNPERKIHIDKAISIFQTTNRPVTLRIFPRSWHSQHIDLVEVFNMLLRNGFKFIYLKRNFIDQLLSYLVAQQTKIWHNKSTGYRYTGENPINIPKPENKLVIELDNIPRHWFDLKTTCYLQNKYQKIISGETVNYETLAQDAIKLGIHTGSTTIYRKTFLDNSYSDIIENYNEVMEIIELLRK